jgi:cytochrome c biogenesis protein CcmG/thiol:disulfide interchange protein DsbE
VLDDLDQTGTDSPGGPDDGDGDGVDMPRRGRTVLLISVAVALVLAALVAVLATRDPATDRKAHSPIVGKVAPALAGKTLDGGHFDIDQYPGRWVVVNFFATWCVPCRTEHPELSAFDQAHHDRGDAVLVSVLYDDKSADARKYFQQNGGDWPVVLDNGGISVSYGVSGVPETYLVAPDGRVWVKLIGGVTESGIEQWMDRWETARVGGSGS